MEKLRVNIIFAVVIQYKEAVCNVGCIYFTAVYLSLSYLKKTGTCLTGKDLIAYICTISRQCLLYDIVVGEFCCAT